MKNSHSSAQESCSAIALPRGCRLPRTAFIPALVLLSTIGPALAALIFWKCAAGYTVADISPTGGLLSLITLGLTSLTSVSLQHYTAHFYKVKNYRSIRIYLGLISILPTAATTLVGISILLSDSAYFWRWIACYLSIYETLSSAVISVYLFTLGRGARASAHIFFLIPNITIFILTANVHLWDFNILWAVTALTITCSCLPIVGKSLLNTALKAEKSI